MSSEPTSEGRTGEPSREPPRSLLIVGIGASAGGLEALEQFLSHVPAASGIAFAVIQHLDPHRASILTDLLARSTKMAVVEARDGVQAEADHVYVIAPGTMLGMAGGSFRVTAADADRHSPIDVFLKALADDQGEHAAGVILSGSGSDGTSGLRAIREHGGLTLAQIPETAKHDSMPRSAVEAGGVDHVLRVEEMPAKLVERARQVFEGRRGGGGEPSDDQIAQSLGRICEILQHRTNHDFSHYKHATMVRRLRRRVQLRHVASADEYIALLEKDPQEPELLVKDLLIGVTQFFRDPEAFEYLARHVLPRILARKSVGESFRVWVPGCASGEEAYSIAMLIRERLSGMASAPSVQIFATDIDAEALAEGRKGVYSAEVSEHLSPERLVRFFTRVGPHYQIAKELREMCVFSQHSLIRDPPFSGLDLVSCRNVLIYLDATLQKKLVPVFHYALKPEGYLLLGSSEGLAGYPELFETVDKRHRVFMRAEPVTRPPLDLPLVSRPAPRVTQPIAQAPALTEQHGACVAFERLMLQEYTPAGAVVNTRGDVLCVAGLTGRYLQPPVGILSTNMLDIAHANLRVELRTALHAAVTGRKRVVRDDVEVEVDGAPRRLRLTVRPLPGVKQHGLFTVVLQERTLGPEPEAGEPREPREATDQPAMEQLESELRATRADLRATVEELESANEELKSSNEELLSTNEELQTANEELQTSQEEVKSVNEELETVNSELQRKVEELGRANSDLQNLFSSTDVATLFLDRELRVSRFTPAAKSLFRLIEGDVGRPLSDLAPRFVGQDLAIDAREVLRTLRPVERSVEALDGRGSYMLRIVPYRTLEDVIAGTVITLVDITQLKRAEADIRRLATAVVDSNDAVTVQDLEGRIVDWNRGAEQMYGYSKAEALAINIEALVPEEGRAQGRGFLEAIQRGEEVASLEVKRRAKDGRTLDVWLTTTRLVDDHGRTVGVATTERDITERTRAVEALREAKERLEEADRRKNEFLAVLSHELRNPLGPIRNSLFILDRAAPDGEQSRRAHAVIDRQVGHMARLIDDLLDVTRITRGKIQLQREPLELNELAQRTIEDHRSVFVDGEIQVEMLPARGEVWVSGDRTRLSEVIGNLLQNAAKFTPRGGKTVVSVEVDPPRNQAIVRVRDTGAGIAPEIMPRLFEAFTQADATLDRSKGGLGLGLALVKGLVEMHGGSVRAASDGVGNGATFTITLPLATATAPAKEVRRSARGRGAPRRVLVIDDNLDSADSLREALELRGHVVEVSYSGPDGLEKARAFRPDIILCDIGLPGMDGYAVARALRADPDLRHVSLMALTGYAQPDDVAKVREAGFNAHIAKPPSIEALEEALVESWNAAQGEPA